MSAMINAVAGEADCGQRGSDMTIASTVLAQTMGDHDGAAHIIPWQPFTKEDTVIVSSRYPMLALDRILIRHAPACPH